MAKGKHSRALFEVIQLSQRQQTAARATPPKASPPPKTAPAAKNGGWLGGIFGKKKSAEPETRAIDDIIDRADRLTSAIKQKQTAPTGDFVDGEIVENSAAAGETEDHAVSVASESESQEEQVFHSANDTVAADEQTGYDAPASSDYSSFSSSHVDEQEPLPTAVAPRPASRRRETRDGILRLSISYPALTIGALALVVLLAIAFLAGKHLGRSGGAGPSLASVRNGRTFPEVLNLNSTPSRSTLTTPTETAPETSGETAPPAAQVPPAATEDQSEAATDGKRVVGRNYIILQSYPDQDVAQKAADLCNRNQIPVTVEQLDAAPDWYCVVTRVGFDKVVQNERFEKYLSQIRALNQQAQQARLRKFEPYGYKWK